ncbi:DUF4393 domain-containing protein (plasmid) [Bacillus cereus]|uniref:DUF4393 domain-containing protein n=1 Tax=Bacillus cereus TaxID=1396 RepID=UPI001560593F|nr:DUF4393 domain-containing protein [Bacillus cereus]QKH05008.1 DUF4393 domain-containing protein [Bacillus cereus]QKH10908.1 DUF4393 domain-containing protein [Bacillus cereus]
MEINIIPKFLDEAVTPLAQRAGSTLSSIWTIAFGGIDIYAEKTQLKRVHALTQFKEELEQAVSSIPEENIVEPPLHIVGPTLEASKYYFENDELRMMFANLIASSINTETISKAHPSFIEIIKQLSPLDAQNLKLFKDTYRHPIVNYIYRSSVGGGAPCKTNVFLENEQNQDIDLNSASISNLSRLGLISITFDRAFDQDDLYKKYLNHPVLKESQQFLEFYRFNIDSSTKVFNTIDIDKGIIDITTFRKNFIDICI